MMHLAVEVWIILIPGERANAEWALRRIDDDAVDTDGVEHLIHIRLAINAVVRIPERRILDGQHLIKRRRLRCESGDSCRRESLLVLLRSDDITHGIDDLCGKSYVLAAGAFVQNVCLDFDLWRGGAGRYCIDIRAPGAKPRVDLLL